MKYGGNVPDIFSGRLTAPIAVAGGMAKQLLLQRGISTGVHIARIGGAVDEPFDPVGGPQQLEGLDPYFPLVSSDAHADMLRELERAALEGDSVGGMVEFAAFGLPVGLGEPFFDSMESELAHMLFSIPGVKAVEFGAGREFAAMRGSQANDGFTFAGGKVRTLTNNSGGINGGITNGMPLLFRAAFRPVPTIKLAQRTVELNEKRDITHAFGGRNDVCILPRGAAAIEAAACFVLLMEACCE